MLAALIPPLCGARRGPSVPPSLPPPRRCALPSPPGPGRRAPSLRVSSAGSALRAPPCGPASSAPAPPLARSRPPSRRGADSAAAAQSGPDRASAAGRAPGRRDGLRRAVSRTFPASAPRGPAVTPAPSLSRPKVGAARPGSPLSRCPWRASLEATFEGKGNARLALCGSPPLQMEIGCSPGGRAFPLGKEKWPLVGFCILSEPWPPCLLAQPLGWSAPPGNLAAKTGLAKFAAF